MKQLELRKLINQEINNILLKEHKLPDADKRMFEKIYNEINIHLKSLKQAIDNYENTDNINELDAAAILAQKVEIKSKQLIKLFQIIMK